jgi:SAM-dependent methyltransferase
VLDYDHEAAHYDATRGGDARADAAARAIETLLARAAGDAARLADIGCGTGIVTVRLLRPGRSVIGIDRSAGMAAVAAGRLPGRVGLGNVTRLPLARGSADVVTMVWLLHLLPPDDVAQAVAEAGRVLRRGGLLITTAGKNDAAFAQVDDVVAIVGPVRARFDHDQTDRLDRLTDLARRQGLGLAAQTTFVGMGQGASPRRWRRRLAEDHGPPWIKAAGPQCVDALYAELARLPDQDRPRPDPVYQLAALRKS